jgi:hypothetical protein
MICTLLLNVIISITKKDIPASTGGLGGRGDPAGRPCGNIDRPLTS